ncbi:hypothetical protein QE152_g32140 [Popillia japonica]|uniref:Uncharacterized protein n=1 Tax=Popillia japonica TaxID=7064 RepID=A0AAW1J040_POPJA
MHHHRDRQSPGRTTPSEPSHGRDHRSTRHTISGSTGYHQVSQSNPDQTQPWNGAPQCPPHDQRINMAPPGEPIHAADGATCTTTGTDKAQDAQPRPNQAMEWITAVPAKRSADQQGSPGRTTPSEPSHGRDHRSTRHTISGSTGYHQVSQSRRSPEALDPTFAQCIVTRSV